MRDIVYVKEGGETPFIERAVALGYDEIVFIYVKPLKKALTHEKISIRSALLDRKGNDENIVLGTSLTNIPKTATLLVNNEFDEEKDFVHQRRSGLNHVFVKECKKKNISLLFNLKKLRDTPLERQSTIIGRMKQNAKLCKKYGVEFELVSMGRDIIDMRDAKDVAAMKRAIF